MTKLTDVTAETEIEDGRTTMHAYGDASLYVDTPDHTPLTKTEPHLTLFVSGDGHGTEIELDATAVDALADAISDAQEGGR